MPKLGYYKSWIILQARLLKKSALPLRRIHDITWRQSNRWKLLDSKINNIVLKQMVSLNKRNFLYEGGVFMIIIRLGCGESITEELSLPHSATGMEVVEGIRGYGKKQGMQVVIQSSESSVITLAPYINGMEYDTQIQKELDFLESRLGHLTRMEQDILSVVLKLENPETLREIINLSYNLDQYERVHDSYIAAYTGVVCSFGFVVKHEGAEFTEVYQERLPNPGDEKGVLLLFHLYRISDWKTLSYSIALPAEKEKLDMARHALRINDFSDCTVGQYGGPNDELRQFMPVGGSVMELNHFAKSIKEKFLDKGKGSISDLMAVLKLNARGIWKRHQW